MKTKSRKPSKGPGSRGTINCSLPHFGQESKQAQSDADRLSPNFCRRGRHYLGTHLHVLQPHQVRYLEAAAEVSGNGEGNEKRENSGDEK